MSKPLFKPLIWVEGLIGSGKTTLARKVGERLKLRILEEPVDTNPYLSVFYENPKAHAFGMQMRLLHTRFAMQQLASYECVSAMGEYQGAILDRSISGDRVFAALHRNAGNISQLDWETYCLAYEVMARSLLPPTLLVYIDVQPETAYERMRRRNRNAEAGVPLEYLRNLREGYKELISEAERGLLPWAHAVRVVRIPWDPDTLTESQWEQTTATIADACRVGW
jgi:deoxyadenosine/deoxycytidine kinase